ncbi:response regulator [Candidatus Saccharibacteria bacterium]|nr:response regulator [Candidatus Saccharibacteria bacterium]
MKRKTFIIDSDRAAAVCMEKVAREYGDARVFDNAIAAMNEIAEGDLPDLIMMDVMLNGPDGFTFLNEMISYTDTMKVPVVIITMKDLRGLDLAAYGVAKVLSKETFTPEDVRKIYEKCR